MSRLPVVSGRDVVKALKKIGYEFDRQRGSHMVLRQQAPWLAARSATIIRSP